MALFYAEALLHNWTLTSQLQKEGKAAWDEGCLARRCRPWPPSKSVKIARPHYLQLRRLVVSTSHTISHKFVSSLVLRLSVSVASTQCMLIVSLFFSVKHLVRSILARLLRLAQKVSISSFRQNLTKQYNTSIYNSKEESSATSPQLFRRRRQ